MAAVCSYDGSRIRVMQVRFTAPAYPGETLRTEMWLDGEVVSFRTRALERDTVVLGHGGPVGRRLNCPRRGRPYGLPAGSCKLEINFPASEARSLGRRTRFRAPARETVQPSRRSVPATADNG